MRDAHRRLGLGRPSILGGRGARKSTRSKAAQEQRVDTTIAEGKIIDFYLYSYYMNLLPIEPEPLVIGRVTREESARVRSAQAKAVEQRREEQIQALEASTPVFIGW